MYQSVWFYFLLAFCIMSISIINQSVPWSFHPLQWILQFFLYGLQHVHSKSINQHLLPRDTLIKDTPPLWDCYYWFNMLLVFKIIFYQYKSYILQHLFKVKSVSIAQNIIKTKSEETIVEWFTILTLKNKLERQGRTVDFSDIFQLYLK